MSNSELATWCHRLLKRLPELQWHLPHWPKGYMSLIPPGLFYIESEWLPKQAIAEVKRHIMRLSTLDLSKQQAYYLSQKIETQIQVLVLISQKLENFELHLAPEFGMTRSKHIEQLQGFEAELNQQHQALKSALEKASHPENIQQKINKISQQLQHIQHLIAQA